MEAVDVMDTKPEVSLLPLSLEPEVSAGVHFLTDDDSSKSEEIYEKKKWEFLEYMPQADGLPTSPVDCLWFYQGVLGSVVCKRCGEVLASRTHWYRHKYKLHVNSLGSPSPLFKCELCNVFFKSRKGYMGHYSSRHNDTEIIDPAEVKIPKCEQLQKVK